MQKESRAIALPVTEKINLVYQANTNSAFVYNVNDWEILRKKYRIVGEIFGHTQLIPALPLRLNPEEVVFLVKTERASLVKYPKLNLPPSEECKKTVTDFYEKLINEEKTVYINLRKDELTSTSRKIIAGKRKHGDTRSEKEILDEELQKSSTVSDSTIVWPVFTVPVEGTEGDTEQIPLGIISKYTTETRCLVYEDLWNKGFFITPGQKFGSDFLVYSGDPIVFHADYIVKCIEDSNKNMCPSELIAFGRLGTSVKKKAVLASLNLDRTVAYITLNWMNSGTR